MIILSGYIVKDIKRFYYNIVVMTTHIIEKKYLKPSKLFYIDHLLYKTMIKKSSRS